MSEENAMQNDAGIPIDENGSGGGSDAGTGNGNENTPQSPVEVTDDVAESSIEETGDGGESSVETETGSRDGPEAADRIQRVYIGPSLIYEKLRSSQILTGTEEEIAAFMAPVTEKYPEAAFLLVAPEDLPAAMKNVESRNSVLHKYYQDMLAKSRDKRG